MTVKANTSVKFGHNAIPDSPVLAGVAGGMIELLDAVLVNGYCTRTADSVVVASGVATVNLSAGNPYPKHAVVAISGTSVAALNDEWRIRAVSASAFEFDCPGVPDGTPTGSVSVRMAPAGWEKTYAATNLAVYRSVDPASTGVYLWVDDSDPKNAKVRGYESMTGIESGTNPFPALAQSALNAYLWVKSNGVDAVRNWSFCGDGRMVHIMPAWSSGVPSLHAFYRFGDLSEVDPGDPWGCEIVAHATTAATFLAQAASSGFSDVANTAGSARPRDIVGNYSPGVRGGVSASNKPGDDATPSDFCHLGPVYSLSDSASQSKTRGKVPGLHLMRNVTVSNFDRATVAAGDDVFFMVRGHKPTGDVESRLLYGAFSLSPSRGWR